MPVPSELVTSCSASWSERAKRTSVFRICALPITSTQFRPKGSPNSQGMKLLKNGSALLSVGTQQCWCNGHSVPASESADTSQLTRHRRLSTKWVSITSSVARIILAEAIKFIFRATQVPGCMREPSLRDGSPKTNSMDSARNFHMKAADSPPIHIRDSCQSSGSFPLFRWALARSTPFTRLGLTAIYITVE